MRRLFEVTLHDAAKRFRAKPLTKLGRAGDVGEDDGDDFSCLDQSLRDRLRPLRPRTQLRTAWDLWDRWVSQIVADFWSISRIGIRSTLGLIGGWSACGVKKLGSPWQLGTMVDRLHRRCGC